MEFRHRREDLGPPPVDAPGQGARLRAARAAADLSREELGARIASTARTIRRLEDEQRRIRPAEVRGIAAATGVPEWFLAHGWRGWETDREGLGADAAPSSTAGASCLSGADPAPASGHGPTRGRERS